MSLRPDYLLLVILNYLASITASSEQVSLTNLTAVQVAFLGAGIVSMLTFLLNMTIGTSL